MKRSVVMRLAGIAMLRQVAPASLVFASPKPVPVQPVTNPNRESRRWIAASESVLATGIRAGDDDGKEEADRLRLGDGDGVGDLSVPGAVHPQAKARNAHINHLALTATLATVASCRRSVRRLRCCGSWTTARGRFDKRWLPGPKRGDAADGVVGRRSQVALERISTRPCASSAKRCASSTEPTIAP